MRFIFVKNPSLNYFFPLGVHIDFLWKNLGGVYMTPGRLSPRSEFTPVPSHGSIFVYMIPPQNVMPARVTPVLVPGREFHSGTKSRNGIM